MKEVYKRCGVPAFYTRQVLNPNPSNSDRNHVKDRTFARRFRALELASAVI